MNDHWFDDAAGPVVRPYAMTRGRTRSDAHGAGLDLIALVIADVTPNRTADPEPDGPHPGLVGEGPADNLSEGLGEAPPDVDDYGEENADVLADAALTPEHVAIVVACRREPHSVAELAADLDLPVGVVRVLIGDLIDAEWVRVSRPVPPAELPDESILREVIDGLRAL
jgi:Protein of unknown function (DUF742)